MAELFDCSSDNISLHLKNIYDAIKEYKKQLREQERVEKININNNEN